MTFRDDQILRLADNTLWRNLDGEAVLLHLDSGSYFGLNEVGSEALALLAESTRFDQLCAALLAVFDVDEATLVADLNGLLSDMSERGLVCIDS